MMKVNFVTKKATEVVAGQIRKGHCGRVVLVAEEQEVFKVVVIKEGNNGYAKPFESLRVSYTVDVVFQEFPIVLESETTIYGE